MLELWGMQGTLSLPSLSDQLCPRVEAPDSVLSMGQIELNCVLMLNWIIWNGTVFDIETMYLCLTELFEIELIICIKIDLALNNLQWLMCYKTKPNQTNYQIKSKVNASTKTSWSVFRSDYHIMYYIYHYFIILLYVKSCIIYTIILWYYYILYYTP